MASLNIILLLCFGMTVGQLSHSQWDPLHGDPHLDLGELATLHTVDDQIRVLVDTEHQYIAIKDLHTFTCYMISLSGSHMTAQQIVDEINAHGDQILTTEFHVSQQVTHADSQHMFGHRVAHFCLHNPTFITQKAA